MGCVITIRRHHAAHHVVVSNHVKEAQQQRRRWRAGTLKTQAVNNDYAVGATPTPDSDGDQSWLEMENGQLHWAMRTSDASLKIYSRCPEARFTLLIRCLEVPHSFRKFWTSPNTQDCRDVFITVPNDAPCHWFNGDWIVQPWDTKLVLKVQRRLGAVT